MAIVARGLGLPEDGSLVAAGLGTTEADPNAMVAALSGSGSISATLTATDDTPDTGSPESHGGITLARRRKLAMDALKKSRPPLVIPITPGPMTARLTGSSRLTADLTVDLDWSILLEDDELLIFA
jgi:hypothetical protein